MERLGKDRDAEGGIYSADSRIDKDIDANISRVKSLFADWGDIVERMCMQKIPPDQQMRHPLR